MQIGLFISIEEDLTLSALTEMRRNPSEYADVMLKYLCDNGPSSVFSYIENNCGGSLEGTHESGTSTGEEESSMKGGPLNSDTSDDAVLETSVKCAGA